MVTEKRGTTGNGGPAAEEPAIQGDSHTCSDETPVPSVRFVQLSDLHLSSLERINRTHLRGKRFLGYLSWYRKRRHEHLRSIIDTLPTVLRELTLHQILITGDLTHLGLPEEYAEALTWLQHLGPPQQVMVVPGNHDIYARGCWRNMLAAWSGYLQGDSSATTPFPSLRVRGPVAYIGLSSGVPTPPLFATGKLGRNQLSALGDILDESRRLGLFRVIYLHHPPLSGVEPWRKRLVDCPQLERVLTHHGAELILHGHTHRSEDRIIQTRDGEAPVISQGSASACGTHDQIASFGEFRLFPPHTHQPYWNLFRTQWQWSRDAACFTPATTTDWQMTRHARSPAANTADLE